MQKQIIRHHKKHFLVSYWVFFGFCFFCQSSVAGNNSSKVRILTNFCRSSSSVYVTKRSVFHWIGRMVSGCSFRIAFRFFSSCLAYFSYSLIFSSGMWFLYPKKRLSSMILFSCSLNALYRMRYFVPFNINRIYSGITNLPFYNRVKLENARR